MYNNFCGWRKGWNISKKKNLTLISYISELMFVLPWWRRPCPTLGWSPIYPLTISLSMLQLFDICVTCIKLFGVDIFCCFLSIPPFRWACCIYLTMICHVFNFFVVDISAVFFSISPFRSLRGWHLLDVCLLFWHLFDIFDTFHIFAKYKQSLKVSKKNPWVINIQQW